MEPVEAAIWAHIEVQQISRIKAMQPLRVALSGEAGGPGLFDIIILLGRERVLGRLDRAIFIFERLHNGCQVRNPKQEGCFVIVYSYSALVGVRQQREVIVVN